VLKLVLSDFLKMYLFKHSIAVQLCKCTDVIAIIIYVFLAHFYRIRTITKYYSINYHGLPWPGIINCRNLISVMLIYTRAVLKAVVVVSTISLTRIDLPVIIIFFLIFINILFIVSGFRAWYDSNFTIGFKI